MIFDGNSTGISSSPQRSFTGAVQVRNRHCQHLSTATNPPTTARRTIATNVDASRHAVRDTPPTAAPDARPPSVLTGPTCVRRAHTGPIQATAAGGRPSADGFEHEVEVDEADRRVDDE
jgi:hypothetical protein